MAVLLASVRRGTLVESSHRGDIAVVDLEGRLLAWAGNPGRVTFMRSAAKPIQCTSVVETGAAERFRLTDRELAVVCSSHTGEPMHVDAVRGILGKLGMGEEALGCGVHMPFDARAARDLLARGAEPGPLMCNCSGKHAGMLAVASHMGAQTAGYWEPSHPVQRVMIDCMAYYAGVPRDRLVLGTDGCGVPVFGLPLRRMALAFANLASPRNLPAAKAQAAARVVQAMRAYPEMVGGTGQLTTLVMRLPGPKLVCKGGAEGVFCLGVVGKGIGAAVKVEDGSARAMGPIVIRLLRLLGLLAQADESEAVDVGGLAEPKVTNFRGETVGSIEAVFHLSGGDIH